VGQNMAPYDLRKFALCFWLGTLLIAMATGLAIAFVLTIRHVSGDGSLRKPAAIAAALADISPAMTRLQRRGRGIRATRT
jgi:hypothetical protein